MALKLSQKSMILTDEITKKLDLEGKGVLIIQHGVEDAINFGLDLKNNSGAEIIFLPKPYSQNQKALEKGEEKGLNIINPGKDYKNGLEKDGYIEDILQKFKNKELIIIEVGGIVAEKIIKTGKKIENILGIVEVTTFGHNRHIEAKTNKQIPTFSVARSPIKEEESRHVGSAVYASLHKVLNELDRAINDCNITMVGYGMIGENVCKAFNNNVKKIKYFGFR